MPDPHSTQEDSLKQHNLEVTVERPEQVAEVVQSLKDSGVAADVTVDKDEDQRAALRGDMRDEVEATFIGPGNVGPWTKAQSKGIVKWVVIGTAVGAIGMFLIGLLVWPSATGLVNSAAIGATAGATFGFVIGGFLGPRKYGEGHPDAETRSVVGIHADSAQEVEKADRLVRGGDVARVDRVDAAGRPVGPPSKDTRPLRGDTPT